MLLSKSTLAAGVLLEALSLPGRLLAADFTLSEPGFATVVIEEAATGRRVRNLFAAEPLEAGTHRIEWDGYDDAGEPCAAGE